MARFEFKAGDRAQFRDGQVGTVDRVLNDGTVFVFASDTGATFTVRADELTRIGSPFRTPPRVPKFGESPSGAAVLYRVEIPSRTQKTPSQQQQANAAGAVVPHHRLFIGGSFVRSDLVAEGTRLAMTMRADALRCLGYAATVTGPDGFFYRGDCDAHLDRFGRIGRGPWYVDEVQRDDAGNLWNAVRNYGDGPVEYPLTPTHSESVAAHRAALANIEALRNAVADAHQAEMRG